MGSPEEIIMAFRTYQRNEEDTLGQFLGHYHALWLQAEEYGIDGVEGIMNLIPLLPRAWRPWAAHLIRYHIDGTLIGGVLYGDFRGFIATISHRYYSNEDPPPGPFSDIEGPIDVETGLVIPQPQYDPIPFTLTPVRPVPDQSPLAPCVPILSMAPPEPEAYPAPPYDFTVVYDNFGALGDYPLLPHTETDLSFLEDVPNFPPNRPISPPTVSPQPVVYDPTHPYFNLFPTTHDHEAGPSRLPNHVSETEEEEEKDPVEDPPIGTDEDAYYGTSMTNRHWMAYRYPPVEEANSSEDECSCTGNMHGKESQLGERLHLG